MSSTLNLRVGIMSYFISHCQVHLTYGRHSISFCWFSEHMKTAILSMYLAFFISFSKICCYTFSDQKTLFTSSSMVNKEERENIPILSNNSQFTNKKIRSEVYLALSKKYFIKGGRKQEHLKMNWWEARLEDVNFYLLAQQLVNSRMDLLSHTYVSSPFPSQLLWIVR